jgi:hypothetical protein
MLNKYAIAQQQIGDVFAPGKLHPQAHAPLVNELTRFASEAGINPRDVSGADYHLTEFERDYLQGFRTAGAEGRAGLLYIGQHSPPVQARMKSACGAILRNYLSARLMFRDELVHELWDLKRQPRYDLIAVPDLAVEGLAEAPKRAVAAWLTRRLSRGDQTAICVPNKKVLTDLLGPDGTYLIAHFQTLTGVTQNAV